MHYKHWGGQWHSTIYSCGKVGFMVFMDDVWSMGIKLSEAE